MIAMLTFVTHLLVGSLGRTPLEKKESGNMGLLHLEMLITSQIPAPPKALCTTVFSGSRSAA